MILFCRLACAPQGFVIAPDRGICPARIIAGLYIPHHQLDITQAGCDKGKSLLWYAQQQNIALDEIIAFGDNDNDAGMLQMVGKGIAMGNGSVLAKACADCVICYNNTDAIADFLDAQGFR